MGRKLKTQDNIPPVRDYMYQTITRMTFSRAPRLRKWIEERCEGLTLNIYAGETKLDLPFGREIRNDINPNMPADFHMDALNFLQFWRSAMAHTPPSTILIDPPYTERKSIEMYNGFKASPAQQVKLEAAKVLPVGGVLITVNYTSSGAGKKLGFRKEAVLVVCHGGQFHDVMVTVERKVKEVT